MSNPYMLSLLCRQRSACYDVNKDSILMLWQHLES